ncbi:MAG: DUF108 domain-containing protein [Candidatus Heimdallarchaeota archaeon]|nr:DUF108 domain-containing protein [Candidatus Heimdallarchaeota archaeon]
MSIGLGVIGLGFIGSQLIQNLGKFHDKYRLQAIFDIDKEKVSKIAKLYPDVRIMSDITDFDDCDVVIEAAIQQVVVNVFDKIVDLKKIFIPMSIGAFITDQALYQKYISLEKPTKQLIKLPSGAIGGFDAINSISLIGIQTSKLVTNKPLKVFEEHRYVLEKNIKLSGTEKTLIFQGTAKEAARIFPKSINVGARLALATLGPEKTEVKIYANPKIDKNIHEIEISSEVGFYRFSFQNNPSPTNPKTSWLAALSAIELLEQIE